MKSRIVCSLLLCVGSLYSMQQDWRATPGQQLRNTPQTTSSAPMDIIDPGVAPAALAVIKISAPGGTEYEILRQAAWDYSKMLRTMLDVSEVQDSIVLPNLENNDEAQFVSKLLGELEALKAASGHEPTDRVCAALIKRMLTVDFPQVKFIRALQITDYLDMPLAYDTLINLDQPLPFPRTPAQIAEYNNVLKTVFDLAKQTTINGTRVGNEALWKLFGRMLYPGYSQNSDPKVQEMINFITGQNVIQQIVLGAYMQQNSELYDHLLQTFIGHKNAVSSIAFSPDNRTLASGSFDTTICLWDLATGTVMRELRGHTGSVRSVAFSPDGRTLASGSHDTTIRLWDLATGNSRDLIGHTGPIWSVAFSPDGILIASGSNDKTIRIWNFATGTVMRELRGHVLTVDAIAFSPDGRTLASGSFDTTIRLWDLATGNSREFREFKRHTGPVRSVVFSPDGKTLASSLHDRTIRLWDPATGNFRELRGHTESVPSVAFSPDGKILISGAWDKTILWDLATGKLRELRGYASFVEAVAFSSDGSTLALGLNNGSIQLRGYTSLREALGASLAQPPLSRAGTSTAATSSSGSSSSSSSSSSASTSAPRPAAD